MTLRGVTPGPDLRWLHRIRLGVAAVVIGVALAVAGSLQEGERQAALLAVFATIGGLTGVYGELQRGPWRGRRLVSLELIVDVGLAAAVVALTGGVGGPFVLLFPLVAFAGGLLLGPPGGALLGLAAGLGFALVAQFGPTGAAAGGWVRLGVPAGVVHVAFYPVFFVAVGVLAGFLGNRLAATEQALADAAVQMEKLRLDTEYIVQNLSSGLFTVDRDGRVVHFNRAAEILLGVSAGQLRGRNLAEALGPAPRELVRTVLATLEEEIPFLRAEVRLYAEDDTARPLGVSTSLLKDAQDRKTGVVALFQDLTEVRRLEAASRRQDRLSTVGEMAATIAHEVRNCVNPISGSVELLQQELQLSGENGRLLELIGREAAQMERFVSELLNFTRGTPINLREVALEEMLEDTLARLRTHPAYRPTVALRRGYGAGMTPVQVDPEQLGQVFFNLALNALESMGPVGSLTVTILPGPPESGEWLVEFADTGAGMSRETLDRIFEPFYTTKGSGTGLGLALAHRIVERHRGRMEVTSKPGTGTRVRVCLPGARMMSGRTEPVTASAAA